jgi:hypothetical protein
MLSVTCRKQFLHSKVSGVEIANVRKQRDAQGSLR